MEEFSGDVDDDDEEDDLDEVDRYIITKISFSKNDTILEWWNKHSLTFPQLSLLAKSVSVVQQVQLHQNIFLVHQVAFWRNEDSH
jgi:hypothetical protein